MTKTGKVLSILGLTVAIGTPMAVYAATRGETKKPETTAKSEGTAKDETIICPITGQPIKPCCCPLNKDSKK